MSQDKPLKFQFRYIVDLGLGQTAEIYINQLSDPYVEASKFCAKLSLPSVLITILGDALARQIEAQKHQTQQQNHRGRKYYQSDQIVKSKTQQTQPRTLATEQKQEGYSCKEGLIELTHDQTNADKCNPSGKDDVFDNLYRRHKQQLLRKQLVRKRSFEAIPFKPRINTISGIIVAEKRRLSTASSKRSSIDDNRHIRCSDSTEERSKKQQKRQKRQECLDMCGIYSRGQQFRAKSNEKRVQFKRQLENKLMEDCTFKPKITSRWR